jgi:2-oxoglutarate ferredoxin oxidoreductase subunit gamma
MNSDANSKGVIMQIEVMFAGFGGQGILRAGKIFANAALENGLQVAWVPSYGPEMRGGTAYCTVVISDRLIGSPIIRNPQHLVAMNRPSLEKFGKIVKKGGVILVNSSFIDICSDRTDVDELRVPATDIAKEIGDTKVSSIVALSAFVARSQVVAMDLLRGALTKEFDNQPDLLSINLTAIERGEKIANKL